MIQYGSQHLPPDCCDGQQAEQLGDQIETLTRRFAPPPAIEWKNTVYPGGHSSGDNNQRQDFPNQV